MDDERLKNGGSVLTTEYFDRLLEQIREIRISERRFYQKITDIAKYRNEDDPRFVIQNWMRNCNTKFFCVY